MIQLKVKWGSKIDNLNLLRIKDVLYAVNIVAAQVSPIDGVYTISAVPTMKPPPTHVAAGRINTDIWTKTKG